MTLLCTFPARALDLGTILNIVPDLAQTAGISEQDEIAIGKEIAGRVLGAAPLVNDPALQAYVNRVGRWIASQTERPDLPWRFGVIETRGINAFAAPGGYVLLTRGLYELLENEAQLAGLLAHEIGHIVKRHHITVMQKTAAVSAGSKLLQQQTGGGALVRNLVGNGAEVFARSLDKSAEFEADQLGVVYAARAGYAPFGLAEVLQRLAARDGSEPSLAVLYKTHPHPDERLTRLAEVLEPRVASLPAGREPPIQAVAAGTAQSRPEPARSQPAPAPAPEAAPSVLAPDAPTRKPAADSGVDPARILRGIFGR